MKHFLLSVLLCCISIFTSSAQPGWWTWMTGDSVGNEPGVFGTKGVPAPGNTPPGLYLPYSWLDKNGNFWIYGGRNYSVNSPFYADLWKFDTQLEQWVWMHGTGQSNVQPVYGIKGIHDSLNTPGSSGFGSPTWVDGDGNLWLFSGGSIGNRNNLWKYDIAINQWAWITGPTGAFQQGVYGTQGVPSPFNTPGAREATNASWVDNAGSFWLFGGLQAMSPGQRYHNDLWRYDLFTNEWTWMKGSDTANQYGNYGMMGVPDPLNMPGAKGVFGKWKDNAGFLWMMGGAGNAATTQGYMDDMWRLDVTTLDWTWMSGSDEAQANIFFGTKCHESPLNTPGALASNSATCRDNEDHFWMMDGFYSVSDDIWHYNRQSNQWTWTDGDSAFYTTGWYGTQGVAGPQNKPNGRAGAVAWYLNGKMWVFGGSSNSPGMRSFNDLWKYEFDPACIAALSADEAEESPAFILFPNPNTGRFTLRLDNLPEEKIVTCIYNLSGTEVYCSEEEKAHGNFLKEVDPGRLESGMYVIRIRGKNFTKLIKMAVVED